MKKGDDSDSIYTPSNTTELFCEGKNNRFDGVQESKSQRAPRFRDLPPVEETHSADFNSSEICAPPGKKRATNPPKKKENYTGKEKSRKIEAASAETVQKMAMNGMHDVGIQARCYLHVVVLFIALSEHV